MAIYTATYSGIAVTTQVDAFEIVAPSTHFVRIRDCKIDQYSDFGDAAAEKLSVLVLKGYTTSGSGGAAATPNLLSPGSQTAQATVETNNTTVAKDGSPLTMIADTLNIAVGWSLRDSVLSSVSQRGEVSIWLEPDERLVVRISAPADELTMNGTLLFEESWGASRSG